MRSYVFVLLKSGPNKDARQRPERDDMFKGHFANVKRPAAEGKLVMAGPFDGVDGWRGLFIFATPDIVRRKKLVATDPVIIRVMLAEITVIFGSTRADAGEWMHDKLAKKKF